MVTKSNFIVNIKRNKSMKLISLESSKKVLEETFGSLKNKLKKSSQEMKDGFRENLYKN